MKQYITLLLSVILLFSCGKKEKTEEEKYQNLVKELEDETTNSPKSEQQIFFEARGLSYEKDLDSIYFNAIKAAYDQDFFKDKSLCDYYGEYKKLEFKSKYKEADAIIAPLSKIKGLENAILINGYMICPAELAQAKEGRYETVTFKTAPNNGCIISEKFIKKDLVNPATADFSMFDCSSEVNKSGSLTIMRKVSAKNKLGVESQFIYKLKIAYIGGNENDVNSWKLLGMFSEEYIN